MATKQKVYTEEFKRHIIALQRNGKSASKLSREYGMSTSTITKWVRNDMFDGSFNITYHCSDEEKQILSLKKQIKQLAMENDILKQMALIMERR